MNEGSSCPPAYFDNAANSTLSSAVGVVCQPCSPECLSCNGLSNTDCQSCGNVFTTSNTGGPIAQCLSSCLEADDSTTCQSCHEQCIGCTGPSNQRCAECRYSSTILDGIRTCVPECTNGEYLARVSESNSEHECRECHSQCLNCMGSENTDCLQCRRANNTVNGISTCLETCPADMYESDTGLCQGCHMQCSGGCSGPTSRDCSSCLENSVTVDDGMVECTPYCPFGMVYSRSEDGCKLTM